MLWSRRLGCLGISRELRSKELVKQCIQAAIMVFEIMR
jgi:hypothetical protein